MKIIISLFQDIEANGEKKSKEHLDRKVNSKEQSNSTRGSPSSDSNSSRSSMQFSNLMDDSSSSRGSNSFDSDCSGWKRFIPSYNSSGEHVSSSSESGMSWRSCHTPNVSESELFSNVNVDITMKSIETKSRFDLNRSLASTDAEKLNKTI